jgi:hypothetical protein
MPTPDKPSRIDYHDREQVVRLGLAALFTSIAIARGDQPTSDLAKKCVVCVDALLDAIVEAQP